MEDIFKDNIAISNRSTGFYLLLKCHIQLTFIVTSEGGKRIAQAIIIFSKFPSLAQSL